MKTCKQCHVEKPFDQFSKHPKAADGYQPQCKSCQSLNARQWAKDHPEERAAYMREYNRANKDKLNEKRRLKRLENIELAREKQREYLKKHPRSKEQRSLEWAKYREKHPLSEREFKRPKTEKAKQRQREYYAEHRDQIRAQQKAQRAANPQAKAADTERQKRWQQKHPDGRKRWWLMHFYNLTLERYNEMLEQQSNGCAICHEEVKLYVDHNHANGHVRGLLCSQCNSGLGHFRDNPDFLIAASQYVANN